MSSKAYNHSAYKSTFSILVLRTHKKKNSNILGGHRLITKL